MKTFILLLLAIALFSCIVRKKPSTQDKFWAQTNNQQILLARIDKAQWKIAYDFTADCPAEFRAQEKQLQELIKKVLRTWLEPLQEQFKNAKFPNDFTLIKQPDVADCKTQRDLQLKKEMDTFVTFDCQGGRSFATIWAGNPPEICIRKKNDNVDSLVFSLLHEFGHAFGLRDTYVGASNIPSAGGNPNNIDRQPDSIMSGASGGAPSALGQDDKNGIIWLYKYLYEDQPIKDCFFPDHVATRDATCEPKYPLIFVVKHGYSKSTGWMLKDDPNIDVNAGDSSGMSALHHAVERGDPEIVNALLGHLEIKVNLLNKDRLTAAQLARELSLPQIAELIEAHPTAKNHPVPLAVDAKGKKITSWGEMKSK